jgi:hypothetical protein
MLKTSTVGQGKRESLIANNTHLQHKNFFITLHFIKVLNFGNPFTVYQYQTARTVQPTLRLPANQQSLMEPKLEIHFFFS